MADCPIHGVPHRNCQAVEAVEAVEAEAEEVSNRAVKKQPRRGEDLTPEECAECAEEVCDDCADAEPPDA